MVGGGSDGSLDLCARVCLVDENENIIFHTYVKPPIPVTNYRYAINFYTASAQKLNNVVVNCEFNILQIFLGMKPQASDLNT